MKNVTARYLLINYLNLIKKSIQKQLFTEQMFFEIGVLKNFAIFRAKHLCWSLFLTRLQACNFPVNIAKFLRTPFFIKHIRRRRSGFIFLINTTE